MYDSTLTSAQFKEIGFDRLFRSIRDAGVVAETDTGQIILWNPAAETLFGYDAGTARTLTLDDLLPERLRGTERDGRPWFQAIGHDLNLEAVARRQNGEEVPIEVSLSPMDDEGIPGRLLLALVRPLSPSSPLVEGIKGMAATDPLTGLPNRLMFQDSLRQTLAYARRHRLLVAVLFIDLDQFKRVNETLGQVAGDQLLKAVTDRLVSCVREYDGVFRLGGDGFSIILTNIMELSYVSAIAQRLIEELSRPFVINGLPVEVSLGVGVSLFPQDGDDATTLFMKADAAMYRAKEQPNTFRFYTPVTPN
jgi:diguanylate cyclase (GGDEF)-like protein/PAS domain S-box-containing protein